MSKRYFALAVLGILFAAGYWMAADETPKKPVGGADQLFKDGNFKEAYVEYRKRTLDPKADRVQVGKDLHQAVASLQRLGRDAEADEYCEAVIAVHKDNWRLLNAAAQSYERANHFGFIVAGKFERGGRRGGGKYVSAIARDRVRALQLMHQALPLTAKEADKAAVAQYLLDFARMLVSSGGQHEPWRLQYLSDLSQLPDYEENAGYYRGRGVWGEPVQGAPVDADGNPIFHQLPKSYEAAKSDGERWRWFLHRAAEMNPGRTSEIRLQFANFLRSQFGEQTMAHHGWMPRGQSDEDRANDQSGTYALHTLSDEETIAKLATGIKRFKLPDEFNFLKVYRQVAGEKSQYGARAADAVSDIYTNRRQYAKAATSRREAITTHGPGQNNHRQQALDQIVKNWGRFEGLQPMASGKNAAVEYRFRNGTKVEFEAWPVKVKELLEDVKAYLRSSPARLDYNQMNISEIGHRLVDQNQVQYLGPRIAAWKMDLTPRAGHVDSRVTVTTPLSKAGAYLLTARMDNGNVSRIIVWLNDTVIAKKPLDGKVFHFVADSVTGLPVPKANVEFFGFRHQQVPGNPKQTQVVTRNFAAFTDADGQVILGQDRLPQDHQWLITATTKEGRLAYLGFTGVWYNRVHDPEYNQTKVFMITDRPVYRPQQTVQFKVWIEHAKYDQEDRSAFANQQFGIEIRNPKNEKIHEKVYTTDAYGGLAGELALPKEATLGVYQIQIAERDRNRVYGGSHFRVEEYKKPEFEVKVEAPAEPVALGEVISAKIEAKYYFGAPVTNGRVKYKVMRTNHTATWYPLGRWDWFYGKGYWWFAYDYGWYPGWGEWGCVRPIPWWHHAPQQPPEVIMENEVPLGPDGKVDVHIDTGPAKELHGNQDHKYTITAEVVDESRRTIVGTGEVLVARKPFKVHAWVDRGHYRVGDTVKASFQAHTLDQKPVQGKGELSLFRIHYDGGKPVEKLQQKWELDTNAEGAAQQQVAASEAGQYRLSYKLTDAKKHTIEGGYVFVIRGEKFDGREFRFNDLEIVTDKREYAPGEAVKLMINTNQPGAAVALFVRPTNGVYLPPKIVRLNGKSTVEDVVVVQRDMPNFFIEAITVANGKLHSEVREVVVPPEKRVLNVAVEPSATEYLPGAEAKVRVKLTDTQGKPFVGSTVLTVYDRSVEYIAGGSNVPEIKEFFWKWRRHHHAHTESNVHRYFHQLFRRGEVPMGNLGLFGENVIEELERSADGGMVLGGVPGGFGGRGNALREAGAAAPGAPTAMAKEAAPADGQVARRQLSAGEDKKSDRGEAQQPQLPPGVEPTVRSSFADTAFWTAHLETNKDGVAEVTFKMPENLTSWKVKCWAMGAGTKVGEGTVEVTTKKNILVRMQSPRFFVERDEVVLSANVHNYLKKDKDITVQLELPGSTLVPMGGNLVQQVTVKSGGDKRVDWRVKVTREGEAVVRMKAITDEESDAMESKFPVYVHGMLKMESFSGVIRPDQSAGTVRLKVPEERRINDSRLEVRFSPTLAGAMVDALPYLVDYPYGCTEQTLNRFVPTIITHNILKGMKLDLKDIRDKRTNLNAQEIGDPQARAKGWKRFDRNPVFDEAEVQAMVQAGLDRLIQMQLGDGGWGWFSGWGEHSFPHTTAVVVHGLQVAQQNGAAVPPNAIKRGADWLKNYQAQEVQKIRNAANGLDPHKPHADNLDAFVYMVLLDEDITNNEMMEYLYRDRVELAVYAKALFGIALYKQKQDEKLAMILRNIDQFLVQDDENQTAFLRLPANNPWWYWYGGEAEANAWYLKLLSRTGPKEEKTSRLVKYLLNNRKHATYWNSTRDTAYAIEALADYIKASGEDKPDLTVEVWLDGKKQKEVTVNAGNLFTFDNSFVLFGDAVTTGEHTLELRKKGTGPLYYNAYLTNFTLEDFITKAGLEIKVNRKYYKLTRADKTEKVAGSRGQVAEQKVEKYERAELPNLSTLKSGDLVEVELEIDSKNDYEYLIFEDPKASGFEALAVRSGYTRDGLGAYMEVRDDRISFFVRWLARGKHSISYRLRAEIPGQFSALPARASAMYAPELKGNSDEIKLGVID